MVSLALSGQPVARDPSVQSSDKWDEYSGTGTGFRVFPLSTFHEGPVCVILIHRSSTVTTCVSRVPPPKKEGNVISTSRIIAGKHCSCPS